jgi:hypothetical protein
MPGLLCIYPGKSKQPNPPVRGLTVAGCDEFLIYALEVQKETGVCKRIAQSKRRESEKKVGVARREVLTIGMDLGEYTSRYRAL